MIISCVVTIVLTRAHERLYLKTSTLSGSVDLTSSTMAVSKQKKTKKYAGMNTKVKAIG